MIRKVLVANRSEIALRIIRACRDLGVASVAVYSEADRGARYVSEADEAVPIGPASPRQSYLVIDNLIEAARRTGADAVHPGYGFLSENPAFARACEQAGLVFVGPPAHVIQALGSKLETRAIMDRAQVPIPPGTDAVDGFEEVRAQAAEIGYPLLVKPSGGGGGRGMRRVEDEDALRRALSTARSEAANAFGDSDVYLEKVLAGARHIEVQILADQQGHVIHVGDRDCSMQRRHQKVVEEAPAPGLSDAQHEHVRELAVKAAQAAGYVNAGTVELLYDGEEEFYVLEVNTRIQVEHPATEMVSGMDLVAEQLRIASGQPLSKRQHEVVLSGSAIECRIYAEDPTRGFRPSIGTISGARVPAGPWVREDRGFEVGDEITPLYDGMIAKLLAWGDDRDIAIARLRRALAEYRIEGIQTNVQFLRSLIASEAFRTLRYDTTFIEREFSHSRQGRE